MVGKLSPVAVLPGALELTRPEHFIFDQMLVDSYIKGKQLLIEKFDLSGQNLAFNGSGQMNLENKNIALGLTTRGPRAAHQEPGIFQSLREGLGRGIVRMDISGSLNDPQVTTTKLPAVKNALGILGTKVETD